MLVATYNIHGGRGPAGWFRPRRILSVIGEIRPDVIALQEAQHYLWRGRPMLPEDAVAALGLRPLRVAEAPDQQGWRGNVVLVRRDATLLRPPEGLRLGGMQPRGGIMAELDLGGGPFRLIAAHLSLGAAQRRRQARLLLQAMREGSGRRLPTLLLGDLNEWRAGGSALGVLGSAFGHPAAPPSFPAFRPRLALDRILSHPPGLAAAISAHDTPLARRASDHLPLKAWVSLPGG
ncbi:hypothetical protein CR162_06955 [Pseudoroseomonas rhizosphaerae]|uniref:Endonuclease/exonuclease/phosphatase domain-containing protein n=1 Tax=Teichococcus rhizosphaerae TaxID=1335062 RepID=A0A2C7A661_9PROT|nr:endonuclease/exonuclease/phosphatase family protein [Pseudoroseomonas rhizosphaerae]PHK95588.1 hypothetical protein CR162_06955 [Pseudoroseomonas rhizosphaerae]